MRVFVTGASGHIGSAVVPALVGAGHQVIGLARSESSASVLRTLGADPRMGDMTDLDGLREAATEADAVIHLAFDHAAMAAGDMEGAAATDLTVVRAFGDALADTGKTYIGIGMNQTGVGQDGTIAANPRSAVAAVVVGLADRGVRSMLVAIPPVTHSPRDKTGFIPILIRTARATGVSGYLGEGLNRWPAAHTLDVGALYPLALEKAPAGSQLYAATEEGIPVREIAEAIGRHLGIPTQSIPADRAMEHFGFFGRFASIDFRMPSVETQQRLGWKPSHAGLIADIDEGHYFAQD